MVDRQYELGDAELEVLKVLWDSGALPVREVLAVLRGRGRRLAYTTVQTLLSRLEHKGFVTSDKTGVAYIYQAAVTRDRVSRSRLGTLLKQLYDGAAGPLVLHLVRHERLSPGEIEELSRLIQGLEPERPESTDKTDPPGKGAEDG